MRALNNLSEIKDFIAVRAPDTAAIVIQKNLDECDLLQIMPHRGERRRSRKIAGEVRQIPVLSSFRVLFAISDVTATVTIHAIQHGSRNRWR